MVMFILGALEAMVDLATASRKTLWFHSQYPILLAQVKWQDALILHAEQPAAWHLMDKSKFCYGVNGRILVMAVPDNRGWCV